jgi:hypothetical protein
MTASGCSGSGAVHPGFRIWEVVATGPPAGCPPTVSVPVARARVARERHALSWLAPPRRVPAGRTRWRAAEWRLLKHEPPAWYTHREQAVPGSRSRRPSIPDRPLIETRHACTWHAGHGCSGLARTARVPLLPCLCMFSGAGVFLVACALDGVRRSYRSATSPIANELVLALAAAELQPAGGAERGEAGAGAVGQRAHR